MITDGSLTDEGADDGGAEPPPPASRKRIGRPSGSGSTTKALVDPVLEPLIPGKSLWSVTQLAVAENASKSTISDAIRNGENRLPVVQIKPKFLFNHQTAQSYLTQRAERREQIRAGKIRRRVS